MIDQNNERSFLNFQQGNALYMVYNHNGSPLLPEPASRQEAKARSDLYQSQSGFPSFIIPISFKKIVSDR